MADLRELEGNRAVGEFPVNRRGGIEQVDDLPLRAAQQRAGISPG